MRVYERLRVFCDCLEQDLRDLLGFSGCWGDGMVPGAGMSVHESLRAFACVL